MACPRCGSTLASGCMCSLEPSDCIDVTGSGTPTDPFIPSLIIDPDSDNLAECSASGLLVLPRFVLGYSGPITTVQTGMTDPTDIAGSAAPATIPTNHYVEVDFSLPGFKGSVVNDGWSAQIRDGNSVAQERYFWIHAVAPAANGSGVTSVVLENPTAGAHVYKATMDRSSGTGTGETLVSLTAPAYVIVKDLGPT